MKILNHYKKFCLLGKCYNIKTSIYMYIDSLLIRIRYGVGSKDYFVNKLYDKSKDHSDFYSSVHYVIHKWSIVSKNFSPNESRLTMIIRRIDFLFSILMYPGLDAMDYFRYEFYNIRHAKRKTFITEGAMKKMDTYFNGKKECAQINKLLSNKCEFNKLFSDIVCRDWIISDEATLNDYLIFCSGKEQVIIKPLEEGGGKGIYIANVDTDIEIKKLYNEISNEHMIIEEIVKQHPILARINPNSVNTIRVYTVAYKDDIYITGGTLRMGNGDGPTDNYSRGGLAAEIDVETGIVVSRAVSQYGDSAIIHPKTGTSIIGTQIPFWNEISILVKSAHKRVLPLGYIGWDVVVCEDNTITMLEANTCAGVELQQHPAMKGKKNIYYRFIR